MSVNTTITEIPANDLIGRVVINQHGCEYLVLGLKLDARSGQVVIEIDGIDLDRHVLMDCVVGLFSLRGWTVSSRVPDLMPKAR